MSGPRRHRPTALHLGRPAAMVSALSRRRPRADAVRTGSGDGPLRPQNADEPAAQRALEAARSLLGAASGRQKD